MVALGVLAATPLVVTALLLLNLLGDLASSPDDSPELAPADVDEAADLNVHPSQLYGRVTTADGTIYEGVLRWGGVQEAYWGDYFNGFRKENLWAGEVPAERLKERQPVEIFGIELGQRERQIDLKRPFLARFGDIKRIERRDGLLVTLKSGTLVTLDRLAADDFADGVRVWDIERGVVDLSERQLRAIELFQAPETGLDHERLHGTVRTQQGAFTGFVQWDRRASAGSDELRGFGGEDEVRLRFATIRSIEKNSVEGSRVTLLDGSEVVLSGTREVGLGHRGIFVDDLRCGRVLVSWDAFVRADFSPNGGGPTYDQFPPGRSIEGTVTTRDGARMGGRLVFDLDESETTETLDAPSEGINYSVPFGMISSISHPAPAECGSRRTRLTLHNGESLFLECAGDLSAGNGGLLIFVDESEPPLYVGWKDVQLISLDRPQAMYPPFADP